VKIEIFDPYGTRIGEAIVQWEPGTEGIQESINHEMWPDNYLPLPTLNPEFQWSLKVTFDG
jgi:hypothetical protein